MTTVNKQLILAAITAAVLSSAATALVSAAVWVLEPTTDEAVEAKAAIPEYCDVYREHCVPCPNTDPSSGKCLTGGPVDDFICCNLADGCFGVSLAVDCGSGTILQPCDWGETQPDPNDPNKSIVICYE